MFLTFCFLFVYFSGAKILNFFIRHYLFDIKNQSKSETLPLYSGLRFSKNDLMPSL